MSWIEVGGVVGIPQTPMALLLFLPGQFDNLYVKMRIIHEFYRREPPKPALFTFLVKIKSKFSLPEHPYYNAEAKKFTGRHEHEQ